MKKLVRNMRKYNGNSLLGLTPWSCVGACWPVAVCSKSKGWSCVFFDTATSLSWHCLCTGSWWDSSPTVGTANISAFLFCAIQLCLKVNITLIKTTWISKLLRCIKKCPVGWQLKNFSILERKCVTGTGIHKLGCDRYVLCAVTLWVSLAQDLGSLPCCQLCGTRGRCWIWCLWGQALKGFGV